MNNLDIPSHRLAEYLALGVDRNRCTASDARARDMQKNGATAFFTNLTAFIDETESSNLGTSFSQGEPDGGEFDLGMGRREIR